MKKFQVNTINWILLARVILTTLCVLCAVWIFSNSLRTGEQSVSQSSEVVDMVQDVASVVAPESFVATASGEDYDLLHSYIRNFAHFFEFLLLGALACGCYLSYTRKKRFLFIPLGGLALFPMIDEWLQTFVNGRGAEWKDVLLDMGGECIGFACVWLAFWLLCLIIDRKKKKKENAV